MVATAKREHPIELEVLRFSSAKDSTLGLLFEITNGQRFLCFTLEDEKRDVKVKGETRIPCGRYQIKLRAEGGFHEKYKTDRRFADIHQGMLHVINVPGFEFILIHCGNDDDDTAGCLLIGDKAVRAATGEATIEASAQAYQRIYPWLAAALKKGQDVFITYTDYDA